MAGDASVGNLLSETGALVSDGRRGVALFVLVLGGIAAVAVMTGLLGASAGEFDYGFGFMITPEQGLAAGLFQLVSAVVSVVASYLLSAHYLAIRGRLHEGPTRVWAYLGMIIMVVLGIVFGLILLVIPGIILLVRWSAATGFLVGQREGVIASLKESWRATKGHGWSIFLAGLVLMVGIGVLGAILAAIGAAVGIPLQLVAALGSFVNAFFNAISLAFAIAVYVTVHDGARETAEVFA